MPRPKAFTDSKPLIVYDGVCVLCNGFVKWLIEKDHKKTFVFTTLQSDLGQIQKEEAEVSSDTVLLVFNEVTYSKSDVALQSMRILGGGWRLLALFRWVPKAIRDVLYDWIAKNRYKWFGQHDSCMIPSPEIKDRFI